MPGTPGTAVTSVAMLATWRAGPVRAETGLPQYGLALITYPTDDEPAEAHSTVSTARGRQLVVRLSDVTSVASPSDPEARIAVG